MKVVIATGGTGGHIYPALSLADELRKQCDAKILFIGSSTRMESKEIPNKGYDFIGLDVIGTNGGLLTKIKSILLLQRARKKCIGILKDYNPDIVIGFGNYISVPVILAAKKLKIKTMIHEQNSIAGKANKLLSKYVDAIVGSYDENLEQFDSSKTRILGNPRATEAASIKKDESLYDKLELDKNKLLVIIVMGSLGSSSVNKILEEYCTLNDKLDYQVLLVTGKNQYNDFRFKGNDYIKVVPYIDGVKTMVLADLIVMRSGATTCAEVSALGKTSITIPSPYVPNNHQYINAKSLEKVNATKVILESELSANLLNETINDIIFNEKLRKEMMNNAFKVGRINASNDIINWIKELIL